MEKQLNYSNNQHMQKTLFVVIFMLLLLPLLAKPPLLSVKELSSPPPRIIRTCCSFGVNLNIAIIPFFTKTDITSIDKIGYHHYLGDNDECNGIIYTKRGGFIDLGHVRDCADWTAYLYNLIRSNHENEERIITDLGIEGGLKTLILNMPQEFDSIKSYQLAGKIAYDLSLWHEIATWFGASYIPMIPERYSSFSPEDLYSNFLGVHLAIQAFQSDLEYDEAMTRLISNVLDSLEAVTTIDETYEAMEKVENIWWTREKHLPNKNILLKRYFDSDSDLIPWLVPMEENQRHPCKLAKLDGSLSELYQLRIKLNHKFPIKKICSLQADRTITQSDFSVFLNYIEHDVDNLRLKINNRMKQSQRRKEKKRHMAMYIENQ